MAESGEWKLSAVGEYCAILPDGRIKPADQSTKSHWRVEAGNTLALTAPRNGWVSFRAVVQGAGEYALAIRAGGKAAKIEVDLFREFYHKLKDKAEWAPDGLVPIRSGKTQTLPDPDNQIPNQSTQTFWVDLFVAADAPVGPAAGKVTLKAGGAEQFIDLKIDVLELVYPEADCIQLDHNSYGTTFLERLFPKTVPAKVGPRKTAVLIDLTHKLHALFFEHRGVYHQLGFTHAGGTTPFFAPALKGDGRDRHVADWSIYDAHYGPLLDGSALAGGRRQPQPVWGIYTPFNPNWPADYVGFGKPGYDVEFVNVMRDFDQHFRDKGWTRTVVEFMFNHKKRYRFFEWDGDEPKYPRDDERFRQYRRLMDQATAGSPVKWRFRMDASWMMKDHWTTLAGVNDFWVNGGFAGWYRDEVHAGPMSRPGEIVWTYSGGTTITDPSSHIAQYAYRTWIRDFHGNCNWQTVDSGRDPWFACEGAREAMMYPGERFGIAGPIPCIRLKVQRNVMQDSNLLELAAKTVGKDRIRDDLVPTIPIQFWETPPPGCAASPPCEWTSAHFQRPFEPNQAKLDPLDPLWWQPVRDTP